MKLGTLIANVAGAPINKRLMALGVDDVAGALANNADAIKAKLKQMGIKDPEAFLAEHGAGFLKQVGQEPTKVKP